MRCREAAFFRTAFVRSFWRIAIFCFFLLLFKWSGKGQLVQGKQLGRNLVQVTNTPRNSEYQSNVSNAFEFRKALLQQNIGKIILERDITLSRNIWENGADDNPESGIPIQRSLNITSSSNLEELAILYLDYMTNRVIANNGVKLIIDGVVLKGVSNSAERFIHIPFFYSEDMGTIQIQDSQIQIAVSGKKGQTLADYPLKIMNAKRPQKYEHEDPVSQIINDEQCEQSALREVSCEDGAMFVAKAAFRLTLFNSKNEPVAQAAYLIVRVLMIAENVRRIPGSGYYYLREVSNSNELKAALNNDFVEEIQLTSDINVARGIFNAEKPVFISRNITISGHPDLERRAIMQFNYIEGAVRMKSGNYLRLENLTLTLVSRNADDHERIPFFHMEPGTLQVVKNVVSEVAVDPTSGKHLNSLPFTLYSVSLGGGSEKNGNNVTVKDNFWCKEDGRIECPDGALLISKGERTIVVTDSSNVQGSWILRMRHVLFKAINIGNPSSQFSSSSLPEETVSDVTEYDTQMTPSTGSVGQNTDSTSQEDESEKSSSISPWVLTYVLIATAVLMSITLLLVTFYRRREEVKRSSSTPKHHTRSDFSVPIDDDGLRENQAIARQLLGDVKLGSILGCGSFGRVYKATWSGAQVAVKVILHQEDEDEVTQEAMFSLSLRHPNVVQTYHYAVRALDRPPTPIKDERQEEEEEDKKSDVECINSAPAAGRRHGMNIPSSWVKGSESGQSAEQSGPITTATMKSTHSVTEVSTREEESRYEDEDESWLEMWLIQEYCELGSVGRQNNLRLNSQNSVWGSIKGEVGAIIDTCKDIARGMKYLHDNGIVHGDLKCDNLLLQSCQGSPKGFIAKVADFGLSRKLGHVTHLSTKSFGTITHMPPELLLEGHLSSKVDVYSFGIIMWELWTGDTPFRNMRYAEVMRAIVVDDRRPVFHEDAHPSYVRLSTLCWDKDPHRRPTFERVLEDLDDLAKRIPEDDGYVSDRSQTKIALVSPKIDKKQGNKQKSM